MAAALPVAALLNLDHLALVEASAAPA